MSAGVPEATRNAFVYLMENPSECPDSAAAIINKMNMKSAEAGALLNKINEYTKAIETLKTNSTDSMAPWMNSLTWRLQR